MYLLTEQPSHYLYLTKGSTKRCLLFCDIYFHLSAGSGKNRWRQWPKKRRF